MALEDHKKQGKKFIPPAKHLIDFTEVDFIDRIFPEIIWIAFVLDYFGTREGIRIASEFIAKAQTCLDSDGFTACSMISCFSKFTEQQQKSLIESLDSELLLEPVRQSIERFVRVFPRSNPFLFLLGNEPSPPSENDLERAKDILARNFNRWEFDAVVTQSVVLYAQAISGKLYYSSNVKLPDLEAIFKDFKSEEAKHASAHVRMATTQLCVMSKSPARLEWAKYFWNRGQELEVVESGVVPPEIPQENGAIHPVEMFALKYEQVATVALNAIWNAMPKDVYESVSAEVIGALLSRQCHLSLKLARNPDFWEWNVGPVILRSMTDCYITLAWILEDLPLRAKQYVSYGLGQQKLIIEHYKEQIEKGTGRDRELMEGMVEKYEAWINKQHFSFLQEVNVGSWSGKTTRDMARECGCSDLYKFAYAQYSSCAHNMWSHLGRFNCVPSDNPLHKYFRVPVWQDMWGEPSVFINSAKYLEKAFRAVCRRFDIRLDIVMPHDWAIDHMGVLQQDLQKYYESDTRATGSATADNSNGDKNAGSDD